MRKLLATIVIVGFLAVDFLFFHDMFKPGETITAAQYLTGALSIIVIAAALRELFVNRQRHVTE
jgi:hypothetical protein